jgi:RNA polymerase sigma-70 factor (ECF subfamily)
VNDAQEFQRVVEGLQAKDTSIGEAVYLQFGPFVRAAVRRQLHPQLRTRFDSLDFAQDVWLSFFALPSERYNFETPEALMAFLITMANRRVIEVFRQRFNTEKHNIVREYQDDSNELEPQLPTNTPTASQWALANEVWEKLVSRFPPAHKAILELLREGYTHDNIARMSNVSLSTVNRIVRRLKDLMKL